MAGGTSAVFQSKEGAEDSAPEGRNAVRQLRVSARDTVVGIAASGVTPYVHAALAESRRRRASTVLITCSPQAPKGAARIRIVLETGPEVLAGSTRLKAGSACKMALNILTTASMVQLGKVYGNRMVDLQPRSFKLVQRGIRLIQELGGVSRDRAESLFHDARRQVKPAILMARRNVTYSQAVARLKAARGYLRRAL
jgi:N-acetylmuramic acid 6-phosphate etherase